MLMNRYGHAMPFSSLQKLSRADLVIVTPFTVRVIHGLLSAIVPPRIRLLGCQLGMLLGHLPHGHEKLRLFPLAGEFDLTKDGAERDAAQRRVMWRLNWWLMGWVFAVVGHLSS
jgi:hypothetical protein